MKLKVISGIALLLMVLLYACQSEDDLEFKRYYTTGNVIYQNKCQNCHGANGQGLSALIPPLTDSVYLKTNKTNLACYVKYGLKGEVKLAGKTFNDAMPANDMASVDIAEVLTYITNSFGNKMGVVTSQQVDADLAKCK
ncbi:MAG TPA: cytochrome c [Mucilaginibacter sp.]|jgi:mono/diheme cytochrome c family protein|nr:cytochrome c [Mucilaginibacter sp.]